MITRVLQFYEFKELGQKAQLRALDKMRYTNVDHDWWLWTYEDAERVGIKIEGFDIDRGAYVQAKLLRPATGVIHLIMCEHGKETSTYKTAKRFKNLVSLKNMDNEANTETFLEAMKKEYLKLLREEYEYLISDECIKEHIETNEIFFTKEGNPE